MVGNAPADLIVSCLAAKDSGVSVVEQSKVAKKKAKRFAIRGDKFGAVAGASLPLIMRLGTGALVSG